ncbi:DUF4238 domain-containing protein [Pantoea agglomerans]|uniref:DUF4238 domain-containing protein n=1 Tax=Enterobacter agglomerans TaxID=549 RepID=UPI003207E57A
MNNEKDKNNHYIPQGILKNFSNNKKIFWYSKLEERKQKQIIKKVAVKSFLYQYPESKISLERIFFDKIDSDAPVVIQKIIKDRSLENLNDNEKSKLLKYIASQLIRTPSTKNNILNFEETIKDQIHPEITIVKKDPVSDYLNSIIVNTDLLINILKEKNAHLLFANEGENFIIGDAPVLTFNKTDKKTVEIIYEVFPPVINYDMYFFPLSEKILLIFYSKNTELRNDISFFRKLHNDFQFINSFRFVFSKNEKDLDKEIEKYFENCFMMIETYSPELIKNGTVRKGDRLSILQPVIKLADNVKLQIKECYLDSLKSK